MPDEPDVNVETLRIGRCRRPRPCSKCGMLAERPLFADVQYVIDGQPGQKERWHFCLGCREEVK